MRAWLAATLLLAQISTAQAQTPPTPETPAQPVAACGELPPAPATIDIATATTSQVSAASDRQTAWRQQAAQVIECRRLYYNAAIARFNEVNGAWSAQLDAFCARRDIRCSERERVQSQPPAQ